MNVRLAVKSCSELQVNFNAHPMENLAAKSKKKPENAVRQRVFCERMPEHIVVEPVIITGMNNIVTMRSSFTADH